MNPEDIFYHGQAVKLCRPLTLFNVKGHSSRESEINEIFRIVGIYNWGIMIQSLDGVYEAETIRKYLTPIHPLEQLAIES